jgi:hypothetical protein
VTYENRIEALTCRFTDGSRGPVFVDEASRDSQSQQPLRSKTSQAGTATLFSCGTRSVPPGRGVRHRGTRTRAGKRRPPAEVEPPVRSPHRSAPPRCCGTKPIG